MKLKVQWLLTGCALLAPALSRGGAADRVVPTFVQNHCAECHEAETKKGGLDLTALKLELANPTNFSKWVLVHDRVAAGEMPPKKKARPEPAETEAFTKSVASALTAVEQER